MNFARMTFGWQHGPSLVGLQLALRAETTNGSPFVKAATTAGGVFRARAAVRDLKDR